MDYANGNELDEVEDPQYKFAVLDRKGTWTFCPQPILSEKLIRRNIINKFKKLPAMP